MRLQNQIIVTILVIGSFVRLSNGDSNEDRKCERLEDLKYELFGTKTTYEDARKFLRHVNEDELPKPFDEDSLEKEHSDLLKDQCRPVVFYFIGRHSARFPDSDDIDKYNNDLKTLIARMNRTQSSSTTNRRCERNRRDFLKWSSAMVAKHDNLITELGGREERDIARRLRRIYPEFFDVSKSEIKIGVTKRVRTSQTSINFLREVQGLQLDPSCNETPTNDVDLPSYSLERVLEAACYKFMTDKFEQPFLEFHKQCDKIAGEQKQRDSLVERVKNPNLRTRIARRVAQKLGLNQAEDLPVDVLDSVWNMCKFENAMRNNSIWCQLFDKRDVEALEYIEDVNSYIKSAYGPKANVKQSCPVVSDLISSFEEATKWPVGQVRRRSHFYFSHADPIKKLLATFGMFRDDSSFSEARIVDFESELKVPKKRHWRTSVIMPFSANLVFVLYRCQESWKDEPKFKVLATVTEQPVKLGGCKDTDCNSKRFFETYSGMRQCDLNKICARS